MSDSTGRTEGALARLGRFTVRRRRAVLVVSALLFALFTALSANVQQALSAGGFEADGAESVRTQQFLEERFGAGPADVLLLVTAKTGDVDAPAVAAAGRALTDSFAAEPGVAAAFSYWTLERAAPLRSADRRQAIVVAQLTGDRGDATTTLDTLSPRYTRDDAVVDVRVTGFGEVFREIAHQSERDLRRAELLAFPVCAVLLLLVFRSAVAAALPLVVGGLAVVGTLFVLTVLAARTEVSVFALNITTAMGLGLSIDYALFIVSRFREELARGLSTEDAVVRTVTTTGRMVLFSALAVAASMVSLLLFPLVFLRSFGYAGIAVVALAALAAVTTLPALLATLGPNVDRLSVRRRASYGGTTGGWHRLAMAVMRRPWPIAAAGVTFLVLLGVPFLRMELGSPDERVLPPGAEQRQVLEEFRAGFSANEGMPIFVAVRDVDPTVRRGDLHAYAARLSTLPGVARVDAATGSYAEGARVFDNAALAARFAAPDATYLSVVPGGSLTPFSPDAEELVQTIRSDPAPFERVEVAGQSAHFADAKEGMRSRLPLAAALIVAVTFVVLFLAFGSVLVPVKALLLNLLSLTATFGAMVWVFQDGHLSGLLDFTPREAVDLFNPVLMFAIAFGLSMDYEVFLLSRVKEEYDATRDNTSAVAVGLERTGRLFTAAALIVAAVFLAFATSEVSIIKMFGLGLALAVLADAFVVRAFLVPAVMRLAGEWNWWAPQWMQRLHARVGISENGLPGEAVVVDVPRQARARVEAR